MGSAPDAAVHQHIDPVPHRIDDLPQLVEGRARAVQLPAAVVGDDDPGAADLRRPPGVRRRHDALEAELPVPFRHHPGHIVPVHRRIQQFGEIVRHRHDAAGAQVKMRIDLGKAELLAREIVDSPCRLEGELHPAGQGQAERQGKAGAQVALAVAAGDAVHGQHHDFDAGVLGALHHGAIQAAVLVEVELIDLRRVVPAPQFLKARRAQGGDAEHGAEAGGGGGDGTLAVMVEQPLQCRRRAVEGQRQPLPHHLDGKIHLRHAAQHIGNQVAALETFAVAPQRHLVVGAAVDIVEDRRRQAPPRHFAIIVEIMAVLQAHGEGLQDPGPV